MLKWIHHLLNPHCVLCYEERQNEHVCSSCETLKMQLEIANYEKKQLMTNILALTQKEDQSGRLNQVQSEQLKPVMPRNVPWHVQRQMMEAEDRIKAQKMREAAAAHQAAIAKEPDRGSSGGLKVIIGDTPSSQSVEELERELGVDEKGVS